MQYTPTTEEDTTMSTTTTTPWENAYDARLRTQLSDFATQAISGYATAKASFIEKLQDGDASRTIQWEASKLLHAEAEAKIAADIQNGLASDSAPTAQQVLDSAKRACQQLVHRGIGAASSSPWSTLVDQEIGRGAYELNDATWRGLGQMESASMWMARNEVAAEQLTAQRALQCQLREANDKVQRARSDSGREAAQAVVDSLTERVQLAEQRVRVALALAGAPDAAVAAAL
jgi:hypothetical protein